MADEEVKQLKEKRYSCLKCDYKCKTAQELKKHLGKKIGCDKTFTQYEMFIKKIIHLSEQYQVFLINVKKKNITFYELFIEFRNLNAYIYTLERLLNSLNDDDDKKKIVKQLDNLKSEIKELKIN